MEQFFLIAEIKSLQGSDGFVIADSYSDFSERFFLVKSVFIDFFGNRKEFFVEEVKEIDDKFAFKFKGFNTSEDAKILIGKKIYVEEKNSIKLKDNTFFIHDLIGSKVFRKSNLFGYVEDVLVLPANDVYVIKDTNGKKVLVPAVKDYILKFNPLEKRLELVPDCDLLYDDEN